MIEVELKNISKTIHKTPILHDINLKLRIDDTKHRNGQYQRKSTHAAYRVPGKHWGVD